MKTIFITGSTRGIGKSIALIFSKKKFTVILNGTKQTNESELLLKTIQKYSPASEIYYFDVSNKIEVETNISKLLQKYKKIDILVNNAGIVNNKLLVNMSFDDFDTVIRTNLYSTFLISKLILPSMIENKWGRIVNMSSISGLTGDFGQTNYSASKAAVIGFTKSLAKETAKFNITVNAICPGLVETDILKEVPEKYMNALLEKIPLKRKAKTKEVAELVYYLCSKNSDYITGSIININGGSY